MSLRETLNRQPAVVAGIVLVAVVVAGYIVFRNVTGSARATVATKAFYSADDGKTWFVDDIAKHPPFKTADGKEAVQAIVVSCKGGKEPFVTYLWRYSAEAKTKLDQAMAKDPTRVGDVEIGLAMAKEVKKPGSPWIQMSDFRKSSEVTAMVCPPGQDDFVFVEP